MITVGDQIKLLDGRILVIIEVVSYGEYHMLKGQIDGEGDIYWLPEVRATQKINSGEWSLI